jgi:FkbM family methyltransferase
VRDVGSFEERNARFRASWGPERRLAHLVRTERPTVLDVGAHIGQSNRLFRRLFPDATIRSFEPDPDSFAALVAAVDASLPGGCERLAFSDRDGRATLHRNPIAHTNSLYRRNAESRDSIDVERARRAGLAPELGIGSVDVEVRRLDSYCATTGIDHVDLLKIDVQGAEVDVLRGATGVLDAVDNVVVEISFFDLYERSSSFLEVESLLAPHGLRLYALIEVSDNPMNGRTDWVTAAYTRLDVLPVEDVVSP